MQSITCPHCNRQFELSEAIFHELSETILKKEREKQQQAVEEILKSREGEVAKKFEKDFQFRLDALTKEKEEERLRNSKLLKQMEELSEELRLLRRKDEERDLAMKKQVLTIEEKIREDEKRKYREEHKLKEAEQDKKLADALRMNEELRKKLEQGSQQLQGEILELDLEQTLRTSFPMDSIDPIGKGIVGADIRQIVRSPMGMNCGLILWESKRTKAWSEGWIDKLKQDILADKARLAVIVTEALPAYAANGIGFIDNICVCQPAFAVSIATLLRRQLLEVAKQKKIQENKQTKAESLYTFVMSPEFISQVAAMTEIYRSMHDQITKERISFERSWKLREQQVQRLLTGVAGMYGSLQGVVGNELPTIDGLELPSGEASQDTLPLIP